MIRENIAFIKFGTGCHGATAMGTRVYSYDEFIHYAHTHPNSGIWSSYVIKTDGSGDPILISKLRSDDFIPIFEELMVEGSVLYNRILAIKQRIDDGIGGYGFLRLLTLC